MSWKPEYRVIYHTPDGKPRKLWPGHEAEDTPEHLTFMLEHHVESGSATGGHLETYVRGIGWVMDE